MRQISAFSGLGLGDVETGYARWKSRCLRCMRGSQWAGGTCPDCINGRSASSSGGLVILAQLQEMGVRAFAGGKCIWGRVAVARVRVFTLSPALSPSRTSVCIQVEKAPVIPAEAGIHATYGATFIASWIPAFARMTGALELCAYGSPVRERDLLRRLQRCL
jgi:hypothetical protein